MKKSDFTNKTVLITGASSGIGLELAKIFAKQNSHLILVAHHQNKLLEASGKIKQLQPHIHITVLTYDLSQPAQVDSLIEYLTKNKIHPDVLINDAGFGDGRDFIDTPIATLQGMINLNLTSLTTLTHFVLQQMKKNGTGKILNLASTGSFIPGPHLAVYCATKAYVLKFSQALHYELKNTNITVTALCPGATHTNFAQVASMQDTKLFQTHVMSAKKVAQIGYQALLKGQRQATAGFYNQLSTFLLRFSPTSLTLRLAHQILRHRSRSPNN